MRRMHPSIVSAWLQVGTVLLGLGISQLAEARCRSARPEEVPHGANELILLAEQEVREVRGVVYFGWSKEFAKEVVVEVYNYEGNENYEAVAESLKGGRIMACVTDSDGKFSFSGLKEGKYLLRLGTRDMAGMNEVNAILHVTPRGSRNRIEIRLPPGT
jgi:hypothetical protein